MSLASAAAEAGLGLLRWLHARTEELTFPATLVQVLHSHTSPPRVPVLTVVSFTAGGGIGSIGGSGVVVAASAGSGD